MAVSYPHAIFPNTKQLLKLKGLSPRALNLVKPRKLSKSPREGAWQSLMKGRSMEFAESRLYQFGDDVRMLDWLVSARTNRLHTRVYEQEKEVPSLLVVDYRSAMFFGTQQKFKSTLAAELATLLGFALIEQGDRIGGVVFSDHHTLQTRPQSSLKGLFRFINHLGDAKTFAQLGCLALNSGKKSAPPLNHKTPHPSHTLQKAFALVCQHAFPSTRVWVVSDFLGLNKASLRHLGRMASVCQLNLCLIYDPFEAKLPHQGFWVQGQDFLKVWVQPDLKAQQAHQKNFIKRTQVLQDFCHKRRVPFMSVATHFDLQEVLAGKV